MKAGKQRCRDVDEGREVDEGRQAHPEVAYPCSPLRRLDSAAGKGVVDLADPDVCIASCVGSKQDRLILRAFVDREDTQAVLVKMLLARGPLGGVNKLRLPRILRLGLSLRVGVVQNKMRHCPLYVLLLRIRQ